MKGYMKTVLVVLFLLCAFSMYISGAGAQEKIEQKEGTGELEIMSWWTTGGEVLGLEALFELFKEEYPDVKIVNAAVAGSKGVNARAVLSTRMQGGNPPDSFQVLGGGSLIDTWVVSGLLEPITFIYEDNNWDEVYPDQIIDLVSYKNEMYAVPVNIHRTNILWYNNGIFDEYNINPPNSVDEFFEVAEVLEANGITPLSFGSKSGWEPVHILESVLVSEIGPEKYVGLFDGTISWNSKEVVQAFEKYADMLDYINSDHSAMTGADMAQYVVDGKCAMTIMGDWIAGYYDAKNYTPHEDFDYDTAFGTKGSYIMVTDTFVLPKDCDNRDLAVSWLEVVGSREGQDAFNPLKGSIPARIDADESVYGEYHKGAMKDFKSAEIVPSLAHGLAVGDAWFQDISNIMTTFIIDKNVDSAVNQLEKVAQDYLSN